MVECASCTHHPHCCPAPPLHNTRSSLAAEFNGEVALGVPQPKAAAANDGAIGVNNNNYSREQGQNVG